MAVAYDTSLDTLYRYLQRAENKVGGGEGVEGCYGTLTRAGVQQIMEAMAEICGMGRDSVLVDIGAGIGRPLLHAMQHPGVAASWGVEIDPVKCSKGRAYIDLVVRDLAAAGMLVERAASPSMVCVQVEQLSTLDPATHAYACWEGMPRSAKVAFGALFAASSTLSAVAVVQRAFRRPPLVEMAAMGFGELELLRTCQVHLAGSQRQLKAYIFVKPGRGGGAAAGAQVGGAVAWAAAAAEDAGSQEQQRQKQQKGRRQQAVAAAAGPARRGASGTKRGAAAALVAAVDGPAAASEDASTDTCPPLRVWMRVNGISADATSSDATSSRVRRKRRMS